MTHHSEKTTIKQRRKTTTTMTTTTTTTTTTTKPNQTQLAAIASTNFVSISRETMCMQDCTDSAGLHIVKSYC